MGMPVHFLALTDFTGAELTALLDSADEMREAWTARRMPADLAGRNIALIWDAAGFRNRAAFELGIAALGGRAVQIPGKLDQREPIEDVARYLENWFDAIVARTESHRHLERLAAAVRIPVVNARTDHNHPCEVLGDLTYLRARRGNLDGLRVVFVGEATNLCYPWFEAAARLPIRVTQVCPAGYEADPAWLSRLRVAATGCIEVSNDLDESLNGADVVYTDCWPKVSDPAERAEVERRFLPYQITTEKLRRAGPDCVFLPCPPVTRGEEVSPEVMGTSGAHVYAAKAYLLHAQNAVLSRLLR